MRHGKGLLIPLAGAIVSTLALVAPTTGAAASGPSQPMHEASLTPSGYAPDGTPIYHLTSHSAVTLPGAHACTPVTNPSDKVRLGVFCADVTAVDNGDHTATIYPSAEGICEIKATSQIIQCASITLGYELWTQGQALTVDLGAGCGHSPNGSSPCPNGRFISPLLFNYRTSTCITVWTVADAASSIELPTSASTVFLSADWGSGHVTICPS